MLDVVTRATSRRVRINVCRDHSSRDEYRSNGGRNNRADAVRCRTGDQVLDLSISAYAHTVEWRLRTVKSALPYRVGSD